MIVYQLIFSQHEIILKLLVSIILFYSWNITGVTNSILIGSMLIQFHVEKNTLGMFIWILNKDMLLSFILFTSLQ